MKKTLRAGAVTLSLLMGAGIFAPTSVFAKGSTKKTQSKPKAQTVQASSKKAAPSVQKKNKNAKKADLPPVIKVGGIVIPVKAVTKAFGANLAWDQENQVVTITKGDVTIVMNLKTKIATVNGKEVPMKDSSKTNNGTFVPLQFIAKNLGIDLSKTDVGQTTDGTQTTTTTTDTNTDTSTGTQTSTDTATTGTTTTTTDTTTTTSAQ